MRSQCGVVSGSVWFRIKRLRYSFMKGMLFILSAHFLCFSWPVYAQEDVLRLLIWEGYAPVKYVREFERQIEEKYGRRVRLDISYIEGPDDFYDPIRKKSVDLVILTHHYFKDERFNYIAAELLLPIEARNLPNLQHVIPALREADYLLSNGNTYGVPICQGPYGLVYNTEKIERSPESWKIFWDSKYKGRYTLGGSEYLYNVIVTALAWNYPRDSINNYNALNNQNFKDKLSELATNANSFWIGQDTAADLSGNSLAAAWGDSLSTLRKQGEIWELAEPKEGTLSWIDNYAITWALADKPFLRKVAEEWINRMLEPDYQINYLVRELEQRPVTTNIEHKLTDAEKERLHIWNPNFFNENRIILLPTFSRRDRNGLKLLWEEAMQGRQVKTDKKP